MHLEENEKFCYTTKPNRAVMKYVNVGRGDLAPAVIPLCKGYTEHYLVFSDLRSMSEHTLHCIQVKSHLTLKKD